MARFGRPPPAAWHGGEVVGVGSSPLTFGHKAISADGTGTYVFHNTDSLVHSFNADVDLTGAAIHADGAQAA
jgi:hypothetical protein